MYKFIKLDYSNTNSKARFKRLLRRSLNGELFVGLWVVFKAMFKKPVTLKYPFEKMQLSPRYRSVHRLMRFIESESERCIGCGLCEKICVSNCISMQTALGSDGRKKVINYSINYGRCVYCGDCADVCPELAIVHSDEYELASEQRAYFGYKNELLTPLDKLKEQAEFPGYGSLGLNADARVKKTPNGFLNAKSEHLTGLINGVSCETAMAQINSEPKKESSDV